jgi:uncharacterized protein YraI
MLKSWRVCATVLMLIAAPAAASAAEGYATNAVNLRAGPGTEYPAVTVIPGGANLDIYGCLDDYRWCDVSWNGDRGWISASYLDYFFNGSYVYFPDYFDEIDVPIVTFALGPYWSDYYRDRDFYHHRHRWEQVWHDQGRYGEHHHAIAHLGPLNEQIHSNAAVGLNAPASGSFHPVHHRPHFVSPIAHPNFGERHFRRSFGAQNFSVHHGGRNFSALGGGPVHFGGGLARHGGGLGGGGHRGHGGDGRHHG